MHPPFCRLELEFKTEEQLHDFVRTLQEHGWLAPKARAVQVTHQPPRAPSRVRDFSLKPRPDSQADAVATVKIPKGSRRRSSS